MKKEYLFIIPARGKSKRLIKKNIKKFNSKPLIFWTIEQAIRFSNYGPTVLSTDCNHIIKKCSIFKKILIMKRPAYLANDKANLIDVAKHVANKLGFYKNIILLQPTSPLRKDVDIRNGIKNFKNGVDAVMSQSKLQYNSSKLGTKDENNYFKILNKKNEEIYAPNGSFFGANYKWLCKNKSFYNKTVKTFTVPEDRSIDIDYKHQFLMAEALMKV